MNRLAITAIPTLLLLAAASTVFGSTYSSQEGRFQADFPRTPTANSQSVSTDIGTVTNHMLIAQDGSVGFAVAYADFPSAAVRLADTDTMFDNARNQVVNDMGARVVSERNVSVQGYPARLITFHLPSQGIDVKVKIVRVNNRFYQVMVVTPSGGTDGYAPVKFLDSFVITR